MVDRILAEYGIVSDANLHKFWKQFTTRRAGYASGRKIVSDANLHKFWKQFTTMLPQYCSAMWLFPMQIYTNFESNSQPNVLPATLFPRLFPMQIYTNFESNSQL